MASLRNPSLSPKPEWAANAQLYSGLTPEPEPLPQSLGLTAIQEILYSGFHRADPIVLAALKALNLGAERTKHGVGIAIGEDGAANGAGRGHQLQWKSSLNGRGLAHRGFGKIGLPKQNELGRGELEMARIRAEKEATLREVLAEVSLLDIGRLLKGTFVALGCLGIFYAIIFGVGAVASSATGFSLSDLGIPGWVIWVLLAWVYVFGATSERSFHEWNASWYFPKLGWFSSLLLAAYLVGFIYLNIPVFNMEVGAERAFAAVAFWLGYAGPFLLFLSAINIGHAKLMEKRAEAISNER